MSVIDKLLAELDNRDADIDAVAARVIGKPEEIPTLLAGLRHARARPRYGCEKVLRRLSELAPELGSAARIACGRPELAHRIVALLLEVDTGQYVHHGKVSEECRRVVCGHAIDALEAMVDLIDDREAVEGFVRRQLESPRVQVRAKATRFLRRHTSVY